MRSESSLRFERGTDAETANYASLRAADLIRELAQGKPGKAKDAFPVKPKKTALSLSLKNTEKSLGLSLKAAQVEKSVMATLEILYVDGTVDELKGL